MKGYSKIWLTNLLFFHALYHSEEFQGFFPPLYFFSQNIHYFDGWGGGGVMENSIQIINFLLDPSQAIHYES